MADIAVQPAAVAPAAATPSKKAKAPKSAAPPKPRVKPNHPPTAEMVNSAIQSLKERNGSSLQAIKKYLSSNYKIDADKLGPFIKKYLKSSVTNGNLLQTKGKGASGSFKLAAVAKPKKSAGDVKKSIKSAAVEKPKSASPKKVKKAGEPKKKVAVKKIESGAKKAAVQKKKVVAKKAAPKAKSPIKQKSTKPTKAAAKPKAPKPKKAIAAKKAPVTAAKKAAAPKKK